jgi:Flp pilus assembly protein TadG
MFTDIKIRVSSRATRMLGLATGRRFLRRQDGSAAVQFGLIAAPFLALTFAIIETALIFFAGQALETAASDASRLIMTGQAQSQGFDATKFKQAVCSKIYGLFDCANGVYVDVKNYSNFASVDTSKPIKSDGTLNTNVSYQPGGPGSIVVVRLLYQYPVYVNLLGFNLSNVGNGKHLLMATAAFRNEPYAN